MWAYVLLLHRFDDNEDKLVVVPEGKSITDEDIVEATNFQERYFKIEILRE